MRPLALLGCACLLAIACVVPRAQPLRDAEVSDELEGGSPGDALVSFDLSGTDAGADVPVSVEAGSGDGAPDSPADAAVTGPEAGADATLPADATIGTDVLAKLANGAACALGSACTSGLCVDGVCCESACTGQCEACAENGNQGKCVAVAGVPRGLRAACAGLGTPCAGSCGGTNGAVCTYPAMEKECAAASCQGGVALTRSVCDGKGACPGQTMVSCAPLACAGAICAGGCSAASPCTGDNYCSGGKCVARKGLGSACTGADECSGGRCVDGVCCDSPCDGACQTCSNGGHCGPVKSSDDDHCFGATTCDGTGVCKARGGSGCNTGADCATGYCVDGKCCGSSSCGPCQACTGGGGTCVTVTSKDDDSCPGTCDSGGVCRAKKGQSCGAAPGGCIAGTTCADGYCCDGACSGACMACDLPGSQGTCAAVPAGGPHGSRSCGSGACAGVCAGRSDGQCQYPTGTCGGPAGCQGTMLVGQGMCTNGSCVTPPAQSCPGGCMGSTCLSVTKLSSRGSSTCALLSDGTVRCWGTGGSGELGNGSKVGSAAPVAVTGLTGVTAITGGPNQHCAIVAGGAVKCWGLNGSGQLGNGGTSDSATPVSVTVSGATPATQVGALFSSTCTLVGTGVKCWGDPINDELGDPTALASLNAVGIAAGYDHVCALISGGTVKCWGNNRDGELGNGTSNNTSLTPVPVSNLSGVTSVAAGAFFSCAIVNGGAVKCWGHNVYGMLGNGTATTHAASSPVPVDVQNLSGPVVALAAGYFHICALISGGTVNCWGYNMKGMIGAGGSGDVVGIAQPVPGIAGATAVIAGSFHSCAVTSGGVKCWGDNTNLQLGVPRPPDASSTPVTVTGW
jgi:hypothetical protein